MSNIIEQFKNIPTTCIADALHADGLLSKDIKPLDNKYKFAGKALTVNMEAGDVSPVLKAATYVTPGDILVIDAKGDRNKAVMGDFVLGIFKKFQIGAVVINGVIRDFNGVKELNVPVFCKGTTSAAGKIGNKGEVNNRITIEDTVIHPGDIVKGDADGVIVVSKDNQQSILSKSLEFMDKDKKRDEILAGSTESIREYINSILSNVE